VVHRLEVVEEEEGCSILEERTLEVGEVVVELLRSTMVVQHIELGMERVQQKALRKWCTSYDTP